jgi:hypothetical protein
MFTAYVTVTVLTIALNVGMAIADVAKTDFVLANSTEVGIPLS